MRLLGMVLALMLSVPGIAVGAPESPAAICNYKTHRAAAEVIEACSALLQAKSFTRISDSKVSEFLTVRGRAYYQLGEQESALKDLYMASAIDSRNPMPLYYRGVVRTQQGEFDLAIEELSKAISLNPKDARFYKNLGVAFYKKGDNEAALKHLGKAIKLDPKYDNALYERSIILDSMNRKREALRDISKALEIGQSAEYYCQRYWILRTLNEVEKGLPDFVRSELLKPGFCPQC